MTRGRRDGPAWLALAAITVIALGLRLFRLDAGGYWGDEIATLQFSQLPLGEIWGADTMPPLYYALVKAWRLLGEDEWTTRLSSALLGAAAVPLVGLIGRVIERERGWALGLVAALLVALSPFALLHAQGLRMYSLLLFAAALALYGLARLLAAPQQAARRPGRDGDLTGWACYAGGSLLALYTHNTGFLLPLSASGVAAAAWAARPERLALARNWLLANGAVLLLWLPYWSRLFTQVAGVAADFWATNPDFAGFLSALGEIQVGARLGDAPPAEWVLALYLLLAAAGVAAFVRRPRWLAFTLLLLLLPPVTELLIGIVMPIFVQRTLIWTVIPGALLVAGGLLWLLRGRRGLAAIGLAAALLALAGRLHLVERYYAVPVTGDWRGAAAFLLPRLQDDSLVIVLPWWDFMTPGFHLQRLQPDWNDWPSLVAGPPKLTPEQARALLTEPRAGEIWLGHYLSRYPAWETTKLLQALQGCALVAERRDFYGLALLRLEAGPGC